MTTHASESTTIAAPRAPQASEQQRPEPAVRSQLFETMVLCRTYEEAILREYHADKGPGFDIGKGLVPGEMHLSAGQEPVAAGVCAHLTTDDAVTATHRPHHFAIAHGVDLRKMTAEIFGRETGLGRGRGGHMHLFDPDTHFSCSGIIAEGYPPALGQAFAFQRRGTDRIAVAVTGEGAANQGAFHESLNLAALLEAPGRLRRRGQRLGASRSRVRRPPRSARTPTAPRRTACRATGSRTTTSRPSTPSPPRRVARARAGEGPSLIEVHTLRMWGHFEGDAQGYRPELAEVPGHDPIPRYEQQLREDGVLDDARVAAIARPRPRRGSRTPWPSPRAARLPDPSVRHRPTCSPEGDAR